MQSVEVKINKEGKIIVPWGEDGKHVTEDFVNICEEWKIDENGFKRRASVKYCNEAKEFLRKIKENINNCKILVEWGEEGKFVTEEYVNESHIWKVNENGFRNRPSVKYSRDAKEALKKFKLSNLQSKL
jgi:hypothetical protein